MTLFNHQIDENACAIATFSHSVFHKANIKFHIPQTYYYFIWILLYNTCQCMSQISIKITDSVYRKKIQDGLGNLKRILFRQDVTVWAVWERLLLNGIQWNIMTDKIKQGQVIPYRYILHNICFILTSIIQKYINTLVMEHQHLVNQYIHELNISTQNKLL